MKILRFFFLAFSLLHLTSCEKNPLWVGNREFMTFTYSGFGQGSEPLISQEPSSQSPFIEVSGAEARNIGNNSVRVSLNGVRVQNNRHSFKISGVQVLERDASESNRFEEQSEFDNSFSSSNDVALVLTLDMSTSLGDLTSNVKDYAISFIDEVFANSDSSIISVLFFSARNTIYQTQFYYKSGANTLKDEVRNFSNYGSRTALFDAGNRAINSLKALNFPGSKAMVVFTDGGDNDSEYPTTALYEIQDAPVARFCIGLKGDDFNKDDLKSIASSKKTFVIAKDGDDLEKVFKEVSRMLSNVYTISYNRSDQATYSIDIKFVFDVER
jgi:hypothetical protein